MPKVGDSIDRPFSSGARADAWLRARLHGGRRTWLFQAVGFFLAFELLAPFVVLATRGVWRVVEGVVFAVLATLAAGALRRRRRS